MATHLQEVETSVMNLPDVPVSTIDNLITELNEVGFASIPNYLSSADLRRMQGFVSSAIEANNHEYVHFNGPDEVSGSGLEELARSPRFVNLIHQIYERGTGKKAPSQGFYQVLRCLSGATGQKNSMIFHYDSYVITALVPITIPASGRSGDLLIYPNTRKIRGSYLANAVDKVILDNPLSQRLLRASVNSKAFGPQRIKMTPGNLYFFWGYRSVHTNEPCDPDKVRATALFHFANPHKNG
jgi:hypothetical protein